MKSIGVILLAMALLISTLPSAAQNPIPFNELAHRSSGTPSLEDMRADYDAQTTSSTQTYKRRHWTKSGKIMTFIGIPLMATGGVVMGSILHGGCHSEDFCLPETMGLELGVIMTGSGIALTAVGATRRSTE